MSRDVTALSDEVVDLLVTWGAVGRVAAAELFQALAEFGAATPLHLLRRALAVPESLLDPALHAELVELDQSSSSGAVVDAGLSLRINRLLERLTEGLGSRISAERERLRSELDPWWLLMESGERAEALSRLWRLEPGDDLAAQIVAAQELDGLGKVADGAREAQRAEIREFVDRGDEDGDPAVAERARAALDSDDPLELAKVGRGLRRLTGGKGQQEATRLLAELRPRAAELAAHGRKIAEEPAALDTPTRLILRSALCGIESELEASEGLPAGEGAEASAEALASWETTLRSMLEGASGASSGRPVGVEGLIAELTTRARASTGESGELSSLEKELRESVGGSATYDLVLRATERLDAARVRDAERLSGPTKKLRTAAEHLESTLRESAPLLPTERVLHSRSLLERIDECVAGAEPDSIESLRDEIGKDTEGLKELAAELGKQRRGRGEDRRRRLLEDAGRLREIAAGRDEGRVRSLTATIEAADPDELDAAGESLSELAGPIENGVRLKAVGALERAGDDSGAEALRRALDENDLRAVVALADELPVKGGLGALIRGPVGLAALPLLALLIAAGLVFGRPWLENRPRTYTLTVTSPDASSRALAIKVVGAAGAQEQAYTATGASFDLAPGSYEIYVNDRYTGRTVTVPDDPGQVGDIPVPPEFSGD